MSTMMRKSWIQTKNKGRSSKMRVQGQEQLRKQDEEALFVEMERLVRAGVVERVPLAELEAKAEGEEETKIVEEGAESEEDVGAMSAAGIDEATVSKGAYKMLTAKFVYDWRFRQGGWRRRGRPAARVQRTWSGMTPSA